MTPCQRSWAIAAIACLGGVGGGVVFPVLPVVGFRLGIGGAMIGLILSANRITRLFFNPVTGVLLDRFGARLPVAAGLAIEALGTGAFSVALGGRHPAAWFLAGRVIWGMGSSLLLVGALAAVMAVGDARDRGRLTARVRTALSLGFPAGMLVGGLTADLVSDNAAFMTATALSLAAGLGALRVFPAATGPTARRTGETKASWRDVASLPVLPVISAANALLFLAVSGVLLATLAPAVQARDLTLPGLGAQGSAGLFMAALMTARAAASVAMGRYVDRALRRTGLVLPALALVAAGFGLLGLAPGRVSVVLALFAVGAGAGGLTIPLLAVLGDHVPEALRGRALSVYQWSADAGGAVGPVAGLAIGHWAGYRTIYWVVGLLLLCMVVPLRRLIAGERAGSA